MIGIRRKLSKHFLTEDSITRLYEIETACFTPTFRWSRKSFIEDIQKSDVWIADHSFSFYDCPTNVGFLVSEISRGEGYILSVEVLEKYRGQGIAAMLMDACEEDYKRQGIKSIRLEVDTDNPAQCLYFKLGYRVRGFKKDYYKKGKHAIVMAKTL